MNLLTEDEIECCYQDGRGMVEFARAIERKVLEKILQSSVLQEPKS